MRSVKDNGLFVSSVPYNVVRCRQLEGTYPGDPQTACWPITSLRVMRGWGYVPEEAWPNIALQVWPPSEPPGLDQRAKENRIFRYQRIRNARECWDAVRSLRPRKNFKGKQEKRQEFSTWTSKRRQKAFSDSTKNFSGGWHDPIPNQGKK